MLKLPFRTTKPRAKGLTAITDLQLTTGMLQDLLENYHMMLDIAKFGVGVAYILPKLKEKIKLYQAYNIDVYFGGTLFEKFYHQNALEEYLKYLKENDVHAIEISTGSIDIELDERCKIIERLKSDFKVYAEVGSKDKDRIMPPSEWIHEVSSLLAAGASYVITEGRGSATAGIYRPSGEIRTGLVSDLVKSISPEKLIFEAPTTNSQMFFINLVGSNVNLGNINPMDLPLLEAQRVGLRYETFWLENQD